jgi:hypothetical protein
MTKFDVKGEEGVLFSHKEARGTSGLGKHKPFPGRRVNDENNMAAT